MGFAEMMIFDLDGVAIFRSPCSCIPGEGGVRYLSNLTPGRNIDGPIYCRLFVPGSAEPLVSFHVPQFTRFPGGRPIILEMRLGEAGGPPSLPAPEYEAPESSAWIVQD